MSPSSLPMSLAVAAFNASAMSHALLIQSFHRGGGRRDDDKTI